MTDNADTEAWIKSVMPNRDLKGGLLAALEVCEDQAKALVQQGVSDSNDAVYLRDCVVSAIEKLLEYLSPIDGDEA